MEQNMMPLAADQTEKFLKLVYGGISCLAGSCAEIPVQLSWTIWEMKPPEEEVDEREEESQPQHFPPVLPWLQVTV